MHILFLTAEQWPSFRADTNALFSKYLPRNNITCDLATERDTSKPGIAWLAGKTFLCDLPKNRGAQYLIKLWHQSRVLFTVDYKNYDAIQVRDMTVIALIAVVMAKIKGLPFYYWLSYPQSEGQIDRAKKRGMQAGMRYWFPLVQGEIGKWLLYKVILPCSTHVFVQSEQMKLDIAKQGIALHSMTAVPMGVDLETAKPETVVKSDDERLVGKRVLVYLGTLERVRRIDVLFEMLLIVRQQLPEILLVIVGDTDDFTHREWLKQEAKRLGLEGNILWTGWLPMAEGWRYVRAAEVGLSPLPRGYLLDMSSPTKAIEYMALGIPVVMNDNPDQAQIIEESGAGICVSLLPELFALSVSELLNNSTLRNEIAIRGMEYVAKKRSYEGIANALANKYRQLLNSQGSK